MELAERPERPRPAGWVIAEFNTDGTMVNRLFMDARIWDDEEAAIAAAESMDMPGYPLVVYALVPAWGPPEPPTATVAEPGTLG